MTRSEFIQRAAIALASNSNYSDDCGNILYVRLILHDAVRLYNEVAEETNFQYVEVESDTPMLTHVADISEHLGRIVKAVDAPNGGELSTFQEMIQQMISVDKRLREIDDQIYKTNEVLDEIRKGTDGIMDPDMIGLYESIAGGLNMIKDALQDMVSKDLA